MKKIEKVVNPLYLLPLLAAVSVTASANVDPFAGRFLDTSLMLSSPAAPEVMTWQRRQGENPFTPNRISGAEAVMQTVDTEPLDGMRFGH